MADDKKVITIAEIISGFNRIITDQKNIGLVPEKQAEKIFDHIYEIATEETAVSMISEYDALTNLQKLILASQGLGLSALKNVGAIKELSSILRGTKEYENKSKKERASALIQCIKKHSPKARLENHTAATIDNKNLQSESLTTNTMIIAYNDCLHHLFEYCAYLQKINDKINAPDKDLTDNLNYVKKKIGDYCSEIGVNQEAFHMEQTIKCAERAIDISKKLENALNNIPGSKQKIHAEIKDFKKTNFTLLQRFINALTTVVNTLCRLMSTKKHKTINKQDRTFLLRVIGGMPKYDAEQFEPKRDTILKSLENLKEKSSHIKPT